MIHHGARVVDNGIYESSSLDYSIRRIYSAAIGLVEDCCQQCSGSLPIVEGCLWSASSAASVSTYARTCEDLTHREALCGVEFQFIGSLKSSYRCKGITTAA